MPPGPMTSGEWIQIQSALTEAVSGLRTEVQTGLGALRTEVQTGLGAMRSDMRTEFSDVRDQLTQIHANLAEGTATMEFQRELQEREQRERTAADGGLSDRLDEHSDLFKKVTPGALAAHPATDRSDKTWRFIKSKVLETVVTACVLGALAVAYNLWRDQAIKDAVDERLKERGSAAVPPPRSAAPALPAGP